MDGALGLPRAAGRELPERDVVLRRRRRLELVGHRLEPVSERVVDDENVPLAGDLANHGFRRLVRHHDRRVGVLEVVGVVLRLEEGVRLGRDGADLLRAVPERDELDGVAEDEQHAVLRPDAELEQEVAAAVDEPTELGVGRLAFAGR